MQKTPKTKKFLRVFSSASEKADENVKENLISKLPQIRNIKLLITEWVFLVTILIVLAAAQAIWFTNSYAREAFVRGGTYTEATLGKVSSLNPLFATTTSEKVLSRLLFATLTSIDYSGSPNLMLAKTLTSSEDGKVWTLTLKDNLKWSNGEPLTVEDVLFTIDLIKSPQVNSIYETNLANVKVDFRFETEEIVFTLPASYADFGLALDFPIVPKRELEDASLKTLIEDDFSVNPVSSGAFTFNAMQSTTNESERIYYLSANPYYLEGKLMLSSFGVHTFNTKEDIIKAVQAGTVSATAELSELPTVENGNYTITRTPISSGVFAFFNLSAPAVNNLELRSAIREGLDLEAIRSAATDALPLNYPLLESQIALNNWPALPEKNLEAAISKIRELYGENAPHLTITTVDTGELPKVANILAENLKSLGLDTRVVTYPENQEFLTNIISKRNYEILLYDIELGADPDLLPYYHSSQTSSAGLDLSNYQNAIVDDLLVSARETLDNDLRIRKYESFTEYWIRDIPAIALYQSNLTYICNKNVRTFGDEIKLVTPLDRFVDIYQWASARGSVDLTP